jgi:LPXTG-motif cell wall-anchored protein
MDLSQPVEEIHVIITIVAIFAIVAIGIVFVKRKKNRRGSI